MGACGWEPFSLVWPTFPESCTLCQLESCETDLSCKRRLCEPMLLSQLARHCMPPAIEPGKDGDGTPTPYDVGGIFTGSVTVVDGTPIATCMYE